MELVYKILEHPDSLYYLLIPVISGVIGLVTNAIGIQMMFKPLEFIGVKPIFGWQGIIPARARKFAILQMEQVEKLIDIDEVLEKIDVDEINAILQPNMRQLIEAIMDDVGGQVSPVYWENTPNFVRGRLYKAVEKELPNIIGNLIEDIKVNHATLIDSKQIVVDKLDNEKHILVDLIQKTINKELGFLVKSGLFLGFFFGIFQMGFFYNFPDVWWVLPLGGFFVGYLTNWIAVKAMFRPLEPIKLGPFTLQGLFLKRKNEVAHDYADTLTKSVLNAETIAGYILKADASTPLHKTLQYHIKQGIDKSLGRSKHLVLFSVGTKNYIKFKDSFFDKIRNDNLPPPIHASIAHTEKAINLGEIIESRMKSFTPAELDGFVRPIFEQDEWILYVVGGALGFLAGWCQLITMFS